MNFKWRNLPHYAIPFENHTPPVEDWGLIIHRGVYGYQMEYPIYELYPTLRIYGACVNPFVFTACYSFDDVW